MAYATTEDRTRYHRDYQRRVLGKGWDLDEVLAHLDALAESGVTLLRVSEVTGLDYSGLTRLRRASRISRRSALAILAVQPTDASPTGTVPIERLEALLVRLEEAGWTRHQVARALGWDHCPQTDRPGRERVRLATLWQVESLLDEPPRANGVVLDAATVEAARVRLEAQRDEWRRKMRQSREDRGVARVVEHGDLSWQDRAECRSADHRLFFSEGSPTAVARAQAICARCPVTEQCGAFARRENMSGVWGGEVMAGGRKPRKRRRAS